ncbi:MAG: DUF2889 domain-containing protein [Alphaproteobacteria bacterium]|nr:DUF2889 domain-containing protein [Alphaproteobacteria bacterium]
MPLPRPTARQHFHRRTIVMDGYLREDGLWEVEGTLTDTKSYSFPNQARGTINAGEPLHAMSVRFVYDDDYTIKGVESVTDGSPYAICPNAASAFTAAVGMPIAGGFRQKLRNKVGKIAGCTHIFELFGTMATVAFQTSFLGKRRVSTQDSSVTHRSPGLLDTCYALRSDSPVTRMFWPEHYTGALAPTPPVTGVTPVTGGTGTPESTTTETSRSESTKSGVPPSRGALAPTPPVTGALAPTTQVTGGTGTLASGALVSGALVSGAPESADSRKDSLGG